MSEALSLDPASHHRLRFDADDFEAFADSGLLADCGRTELIDGDIYVMSPQYTRHAMVTSRLLVAIATRLQAIGSDLEVLADVSVRVSDDSVPEPDLAVIRPNHEKLLGAGSVVLVIEVSNTTLSTDLGRKAELYAAAGIPEYWVVDLNERRVLMHEFPSADGYEGQLDLLIGEPLASAAIEGLNVPTDRLLD